MDPKVSVLVPTYNREEHIRPCLDSILNQSYSNLEIVAFDDGSTDTTVDIIKSYREVKLICGEENRGVGYARNRLLEKCATQYAIWHDSDDISNKFRVEMQLEKMVSTNAPIVFCQWKYISEMHEEEAGVLPEATTLITNRCMPGSMFDFDRVRDLRFNEEVRFGGEDTLWLLALKKRFGDGVYIDRVLYYMRYHRKRISSLKKLNHFRREVAISDRAYDLELNKIEREFRN